ncbi:MAG: aldehyde dehydrogenase family protein [bacterium]
MKTSRTSQDMSVISSVNPATLEMVGEVKATQLDDVEEIVRKAREAFPAWRDLGPKRRAEILMNAQQILLRRCEEFGRLITQEMGRPFVEAVVMEVEACVDLMGYYAKYAQRFLSNHRVPLHNMLLKRRKSRDHVQPLGVVGVISPWNWPLFIPMGSIAPALVAGNAVVFKPSELTPLAGEKIRALFLDAGVPETVFQIVQGGPSVGGALVDSDVEKIFFTGSTDVGRLIMKQAAPKLKKCVLELGGNDPAIICDDADLENASSGIVWGAFSNCGQNCNAVERVYVDASVAEDFIRLVVEKAKTLRVGDGMEYGTDVGPLVSEAQLQKMEGIVKRAVGAGAKILTGGKRLHEMKGYFFEPTAIFWDRTLCPADEEIFGPIVTITPVKDDEEAIRLANRSTFGLAASVWTENLGRGHQIAERIESGSVMVNDVIVSFGIPEAERTGMKNSGVGWANGKKGLDEMVSIQYIHANSQCHIQNFWWFPYKESVVRTMKAGLDFLYTREQWKRMRALPRVIKGFAGHLLLNRRRNDKL